MNTPKTDKEKIEAIYRALGFSNVVYDEEHEEWRFYTVKGITDLDLIREGSLSFFEEEILGVLNNWLDHLQ